MYEEIPYKYKYMLTKIFQCIIEYISKNVKNNFLIESKLILINNYILDLFHSQEISRNELVNIKHKNSSNSSLISRKTMSPKFEKDVTLTKFNNIFLNIKKSKVDNSKNSGKRPISPHKDKYIINKLKKLLKSEQEKSMIKELSYLKKLTFVQEKLNYYESRKNNYEKMNKNSEIQNKSVPFLKFKDEKNFNTKLIKSPSYNLSYLTVINSCKNNSINLLQNNIFPNTSRTFKHSKSLNKLNNRPHIKWNLKNKDFRNNSNKGEQLLELIKEKNNFINSYKDKI